MCNIKGEKIRILKSESLMTATVVTSYVAYIYVANFITQLASYLMYIY